MNKQKYAPVSADGLDESFIATATAVGSPYPTEARPYLEVVAPATLPEGFTFEAQVNGRPFLVTVPMGGVEEGQRFPVQVPVESNFSGATRSSVPIGHWKDDLVACCGLGCCHPTFWMAWCCPMILLGQVMHRLKLTWLADEGGTSAQTAATFRIVFILSMLWVAVRALPYIFPLAYYDISDEGFGAAYFIFELVLVTLVVLRIVLICKTRRHIRMKYQIPEQQCHGCEDCCCAYWCSCCTVSQMARHTGDYATHGSRWCSETGMPPSAP